MKSKKTLIIIIIAVIVAAAIIIGGILIWKNQSQNNMDEGYDVVYSDEVFAEDADSEEENNADENAAEEEAASDEENEAAENNSEGNSGKKVAADDKKTSASDNKKTQPAVKAPSDDKAPTAAKTPANTDGASRVMKLYDKNNILSTDTGYRGKVCYEDEYAANDGTMKNNVLFAWLRGENECSASYSLAGKYNKVSGNMFLSQAYKSTLVTGYFVAYGDGEVIYTSPTIGKNVVPADFSFDVTGVQQLDITWYSADEYDSDVIEMCISNFIAEKTA